MYHSSNEKVPELLSFGCSLLQQTLSINDSIIVVFILAHPFLVDFALDLPLGYLYR